MRLRCCLKFTRLLGNFWKIAKWEWGALRPRSTLLCKLQEVRGLWYIKSSLYTRTIVQDPELVADGDRNCLMLDRFEIMN